MSIFRRKQSLKDAERLLPIDRNQEHYPSKMDFVGAAIANIQRGLSQYQAPKDRQLDQTLAEYEFCTRTRKKDNLGLVALSDGFVLHKVTEGALAIISHRLKIPQQGDAVQYHREAFDIDIQCLPPPPINLVGLEQISRQEAAIKQVLSFEMDIVWCAATNWEYLRANSMPMTSC